MLEQQPLSDWVGDDYQVPGIKTAVGWAFADQAGDSGSVAELHSYDSNLQNHNCYCQLAYK
jgi:hypothetical protein